MVRRPKPAPAAPTTPASALAQNLARSVSLSRAENGWSRRQLAETSGLSERFIAEVERGTANPSLASLAALGRALHLTVPDMLTGESQLLPRLGRLLAARSNDEQEKVADWLEEKLGGLDPARRIALLGIRGAGKTTVGKLLAQRLSCAFVELDRLVEEAAGHKLGQIFELHGEAYYRRLEREVLQKTLTTHRDVVIATGGGLVTNEETYTLLRSQCRTVWLKAKPEEYLVRVRRQGDQRPFDRHPQALVELKALLATREPAYRRAEYATETTGHEPEAVAKRIAVWVERPARQTARTE